MQNRLQNLPKHKSPSLDMDLQTAQDILTRSLDKECPAEILLQTRAMLKPSPQVTPETAISIYRNNYTGALANALATAYPICRKILGHDCFNGIAREYIDRSPSRLPNLNCYGDSFPAFLGAWTTGKTAFAEFGYLDNLAHLEWYWHIAYYQDDDEPFDFTAFAKASQSSKGKIRLRVSHSLNLLKSDYPVFEIWETNRDREEADKVHANRIPQYLVIYRQNSYPSVDLVSADIYSLLQNCMDGVALAELAEQVTIGEDRAVELLPELVRRTWVTGFEAT